MSDIKINGICLYGFDETCCIYFNDAAKKCALDFSDEEAAEWNQKHKDSSLACRETRAHIKEAIKADEENNTKNNLVTLWEECEGGFSLCKCGHFGEIYNGQHFLCVLFRENPSYLLQLPNHCNEVCKFCSGDSYAKLLTNQKEFLLPKFTLLQKIKMNVTDYIRIKRVKIDILPPKKD